MSDIEEIKKALKEDFACLYQKNFSTMWRTERLKIGCEIDIMEFHSLQAFFARKDEVIKKLIAEIKVVTLDGINNAAYIKIRLKAAIEAAKKEIG